MTTSEALLLLVFLGLCTIPGIVSGALMLKKARGFELRIVLLLSMAIGAPLLFFFVWHLFDRPQPRVFWDLSNFGSALGMGMVHGGPAAIVIGAVSIIATFVSRALFKRSCASSKKEKPIQISEVNKQVEK